MILCAPTANAEVVSDADPLLRVAVPSTVAPSLNCTVPLAVAGTTVAVNDTACPPAEGLSEDAKVTLAFAFATVTDAAAELLLLLLASPRYTAVIACEPAARFTALMDADPPLRVAVPNTVAPSWNCTVPVAEVGVTVAVSTTLCPN